MQYASLMHEEENALYRFSGLFQVVVEKMMVFP